MNDVFYKSVSELGTMLANKEISSVELLQKFIDRTSDLDSKVKAFLFKDVDFAMKAAKASDSRRAHGESLGALDGIPIAIKDAFAIANQPLTCASKMLENYVSPYTATCIKNLEEAGAVFWGRCNMDELAMGASCECSAFGATHNPWNLDYIPGGSSGGSAAALSAGFCALALGSDTGGSIRQPAAHCGVVGMKPTYGLVSRYGLAAFASSLDQAGPMARNIKDAAIFLEALVSYDPKDSTSIKIDKPSYSKQLNENSLKGKKIGVPKEYFPAELDSEIRSHIEKSIALCKEQGAEIVEISLPHTELAVPVYCIIATAEASSNLARLDGIRYGHRSSKATDSTDIYSKSRAEGFGAEVKRRIILGTYVLTSGYYDAYYLRAQKARTLIRQDFEKVFASGIDVILAPTTPSTAFKIGEKISDPVSMYLLDLFTINVNLAGLPALSVPCGIANNAMPVGLQMIGRPFDEANLLSYAYAFEKVSLFKNAQPKL